MTKKKSDHYVNVQNTTDYYLYARLSDVEELDQWDSKMSFLMQTLCDVPDSLLVSEQMGINVIGKIGSKCLSSQSGDYIASMVQDHLKEMIDSGYGKHGKQVDVENINNENDEKTFIIKPKESKKMYFYHETKFESYHLHLTLIKNAKTGDSKTAMIHLYDFEPKINTNEATSLVGWIHILPEIIVDQAQKSVDYLLPVVVYNDYVRHITKHQWQQKKTIPQIQQRSSL